MFVSITICVTFSCQIIFQKSSSVLSLGPFKMVECDLCRLKFYVNNIVSICYSYYYILSNHFNFFYFVNKCIPWDAIYWFGLLVPLKIIKKKSMAYCFNGAGNLHLNDAMFFATYNKPDVMLTYFSNNLLTSFIMISLLLLFLTHTAPCYITHMYVAGVDVIRRVGFSLQNNSGVIVCDKWKNEQNCNGILYLKKTKKNPKYCFCVRYVCIQKCMLKYW